MEIENTLYTLRRSFFTRICCEVSPVELRFLLANVAQ